MLPKFTLGILTYGVHKNVLKRDTDLEQFIF